MEDLKLFPILKNNKYYDTDCAFIGTCENPLNNRISMGYGKITLDGDLQFSLNYKVVNTPYNKDCEKNWVFYNDSNGKINVIYQWYPLTIGKITSDSEDDSNDFNDLNDINNYKSNPKLDIIKTKDMPPFFQNVRGSSNGCEIEDEIWFLCHVVEYCQPREYYHFFAVFDNSNMNIKRWSHLFKFEGEKIEYALGLIVEEKRIIISYSKWDSDPAICIYDKEKVEKEMF
jgi:hypothetical protein